MSSASNHPTWRAAPALQLAPARRRALLPGLLGRMLLVAALGASVNACGSSGSSPVGEDRLGSSDAEADLPGDEGGPGRDGSAGPDGPGDDGPPPADGGATDSATDGGPLDAGDSVDGAGWQERAPLSAGPRQETAVVELGGLIYVLGGFDERGEVQTAVEAYDPTTDSWSSRAPLPEAIHHANAAAAGGRLFVLGALRELTFTALGAGYAYDPEQDGWTPVSPLPEGRERGSAAVAALGPNVYLAGGFRGGSLDEVDRYDSEADQWETLPALPAPRDHLVGAASGGVFYAIGGRNNGVSAHTDRVDAFDPALGSWQSRAPMPTSRGGSAAGVVDGLILVVGGEGNGGAASGVFAETEAYDPVTDRWTTLEPMLTPRHGTGAAGLGGRLYVPGGADREAFSAVDTQEIYVLAP